MKFDAGIDKSMLTKILSRTGFTDGCWNWNGMFGGDGYPYVNLPRRFKVRMARVHRLIYWMVYGGYDQSLLVLHRCDNPKCVRPSHLFLGTAQDNMADRDRKQRQASGDRSGPRIHRATMTRVNRLRAKLTMEKAREIRSKYIPKEYGLAKLAGEYGVSTSLIRWIVIGRAWREV